MKSEYGIKFKTNELYVVSDYLTWILVRKGKFGA